MTPPANCLNGLNGLNGLDYNVSTIVLFVFVVLLLGWGLAEIRLEMWRRRARHFEQAWLSAQDELRQERDQWKVE